MAIETTQRTIAIVIFSGCNVIDVAGPAGVFGMANDIAQKMGCRTLPYRISLIANEIGAVRTSCGVQFHATGSLLCSDILADTLICAGGKGSRTFIKDVSAMAAIQRHAKQSRRVASVCTGAFLLAAAGLLDGRRATTHWAHCTALSKMFDNVLVEPDPIFLEDGGILTSAGVTAGLDLALAMVESDLGRDVAMQSARELVMYLKRPGNQSQFSSHLSAQMASPGKMRDTQLWILNNLQSEITVESLAEQAAMSLRTFVRKFKEATGMPPAKFVGQCRVEAAKRLLEESDLHISQIAHNIGFGNEDRMRRSFHRLLGVSPEVYRRHFSSIT